MWLVLRVIYLGLYLAGTATCAPCLGWRVSLPDWYGATAALKRLNQLWLGRGEWRRNPLSCRLGCKRRDQCAFFGITLNGQLLVPASQIWFRARAIRLYGGL